MADVEITDNALGGKGEKVNVSRINNLLNYSNLKLQKKNDVIYNLSAFRNTIDKGLKGLMHIKKY